MIKQTSNFYSATSVYKVIHLWTSKVMDRTRQIMKYVRYKCATTGHRETRSDSRHVVISVSLEVEISGL
jgi:hypothetical protein